MHVLCESLHRKLKNRQDLSQVPEVRTVVTSLVALPGDRLEGTFQEHMQLETLGAIYLVFAHLPVHELYFISIIIKA